MEPTQSLLRRDVQEYIRSQENEDIRKLSFRRSPFSGVSMSKIAEQIAGRQRAFKKLPTWYKPPGILFPVGQSLEQSSSEAVAQYKSTLIGGSTFADLSSGFGVDAYFLSRHFRSGFSIEPDTELLAIQKHNHRVLGCCNLTYVSQSANQFMRESSHVFDWIYIDPSRRKGGRRLIRLEDCDPNVVDLLPVLFRASPNVLIKASPLLDITSGIKSLRNVKRVVAVEQDGECRELLFILHRDHEGPTEIEATSIDQEKSYSFCFTQGEEDAASGEFKDPLTYLFEPAPGLLKAGAFKLVARRFGIHKIAPNTHLYTGTHPASNFPGRTFRLMSAVRPAASVKAFFPNGMALAISRNHPLAASELLKKCRLRMGGSLYLLAFRGLSKNFVFISERLQS